MATATSVSTRRSVETRLIEKAWKDPEFRKEVVRDPKGMLEKHLGQKLPGQLKVFIHEEDINTMHFSIPPAPQNVSELSDEELEKIAGGTDLFVVTLTGVSAAVLGTALVGTIGHASGAW